MTFAKNMLPTFHIDNLDCSEDTIDGRETEHILRCAAFQLKKANCKNEINLDIDLYSQEEKLKYNPHLEFYFRATCRSRKLLRKNSDSARLVFQTFRFQI